MKDTDGIIAVTELAISKIDQLDDVIDKALAPVKDYTGTLSDVISPVRALVGFYSLAKRMKFKRFLKAYANAINSEIRPTELTPRLQKYLTTDKNIEFVVETIESAMNAKSVKCSGILGFFAGCIIRGSKDVEYKDFIVINALANLIDEDLDYFAKLYQHIPSEKRYKNYRVCDMLEELRSLGLDRFHLELTLEKLKNNHIVGFDAGGLGNVGNAWGAFRFNENTDYFYNLLIGCT